MSSVRLPRLLRTVSFKLAGIYILVFGLSIAILGMIMYSTIESTVEGYLVTRIETEAARLAGQFRSAGLKELLEDVNECDSPLGDGNLDYLVVAANGQRLGGNLPFIPDGTGWRDVVYAGGQSQRHIPTRVKITQLDGGIRLAVGDDLELIRSINTTILSALGWLLFVICLLGTAGGFFLSRRFLAQVDAIRGTAEAIIDGDLRRRIPLRDTNDDLDRLSATVNRMLDRIADLMENLRQISSDIAHDLRTPLTRLRNKLEMLRVSELPNPKHRTAIEAAIADTENILETFSSLLRIAQVEAGIRRSGFDEIDLSGLFENVYDAFSAAAEADGRELIANIQPGLKFLGDHGLITQMLANLIDNAIRHTPPGTRIEIVLTQSASGLVGSVTDNGPGVPAVESERIFWRFYRLERSRTTPGSGLGLALVAAIADLHGIDLSVRDNAPGLSVIVKFGNVAMLPPVRSTERQSPALSEGTSAATVRA